MKEEIKDIEEAKRVDYERLDALAKDSFNNMTDAERTAWIRDRISEDAALIYARTIARKISPNANTTRRAESNCCGKNGNTGITIQSDYITSVVRTVIWL